MTNIDYEYVDESSIDENYKCSIGSKPFKHSVTTPYQGDLSCPTCCETLSTKNLTPITTSLVLNILDKLLVKCSQCQQSGTQRGNLNDHITKFCSKTLVICTASDIKCPWSGAHDELKYHLSICNYEKLRSVLSQLISINQQFEEQIQTLTNHLQTLQSADGFNVWYMHERWVQTNHTISGWKNAYTHNHTCIIFNGKGNSMKICSKHKDIDKFTLISFETTSAWHDNLQINVIGKHIKQDIYSKIIILQFNQSKVFQFDWKNINQIKFIPIHGTQHSDIQYDEKYFTLTWILLG
ncbi:unnamed protein product [Rotaria sordida]|uniref:Uncharacterized protein n=1 Tax=Rotaria sordida TaxID=392033 RepID=A0A815R0D1_9BILA|nr:unnamed protein product [Rotaria sordida]CAF3947550.1 unnamed protein product [Rotaria sordida]